MGLVEWQKVEEMSYWQLFFNAFMSYFVASKFVTFVEVLWHLRKLF